MEPINKYLKSTSVFRVEFDGGHAHKNIRAHSKAQAALLFHKLNNATGSEIYRIYIENCYYCCYRNECTYREKEARGFVCKQFDSDIEHADTIKQIVDERKAKYDSVCKKIDEIEACLQEGGDLGAWKDRLERELVRLKEIKARMVV